MSLIDKRWFLSIYTFYIYLFEYFAEVHTACCNFRINIWSRLFALVDLWDNLSPLILISLLPFNSFLFIKFLNFLLNFSFQDSITRDFADELVLLHLELMLAAVVLQLCFMRTGWYAELCQYTTTNNLDDDDDKNSDIPVITIYITIIISILGHWFLWSSALSYLGKWYSLLLLWHKFISMDLIQKLCGRSFRIKGSGKTVTHTLS